MGITKIPTDREILNRLRGNAAAGWMLLFETYDPLILSIVRWPKWNFSEEEQQDVYQNIHMSLQSALPRFQQKSSLRWFIKRIAMHQCVDEIRRQKRWRTVMTPLVQQTSSGQWHEMEMADPATRSPHDDVERNERRGKLYSALERMQKTCRDSIRMFYLQHMSYKDMSQHLGVTVNTVGSRLAKCLDKLKKEIRRHSFSERTDE